MGRVLARRPGPAGREEGAKESQRDEKEAKAPDPAALAKREAARWKKVDAGLDDLGLWIVDLLRQGLASLQTRPQGLRVWEEQARWLVDAQAPGLARRVRQLAGLPLTGDGWHEAVLDRLARLHLVVEGRRRLDTLPVEVQADLRAVIGWTVDQDEIRRGSGGAEVVRDVWQVVGQHVEVGVEDRLRTQRTWLMGRDTGRPALVLDFAHGNSPSLDVSLPPGLQIDAELAFFPGAAPSRALVKERHGAPQSIDEPTGHTSMASAHAAYGAMLARAPWIELVPLVLIGVVLQPHHRGREGRGGWSLRDAAGGVLPVSPRFVHGWEWLGLTGGRPFILAGEFDGTSFHPLAGWLDGRFRSVPGSESVGDSGGGLGITSRFDGPSDLVELSRTASVSALVGVDRQQAPSIPSSSSPLAAVLSGLETVEPAAPLLGLAATTWLYGQIGRAPSG